MRKHIATIVTGCRILGSILLLFYPTYSAPFYITYIICGISDMIDGTIARMTKATSNFGSKMDTFADLIFLTVAFIKILPEINIPYVFWTWIAVIAIIKISNVILGYTYNKQFISIHSIMNKITGLLLFLFPLTLSFIEQKYTFVIVCSVATFAAIQEGVYIIKQYKLRQR